MQLVCLKTECTKLLISDLWITDIYCTQKKILLIFSSFLATSANSRFEKKPFSAPVLRKSTLTDKEKISYFVNFSIPPRGDEVSCCSIKRDGIQSGEHRFSSLSNRNNPVLDDIEFESKSLHPVKFDQKLLDVWFTHNLTFKIYSRLAISMLCIH